MSTPDALGLDGEGQRQAPPGNQAAEREHRKGQERAQRDRRRALVASALLTGATYQQIADGLPAELRVSKATIGNDVAVIRAEWRRRAAQTFDTYVAEEVAK